MTTALYRDPVFDLVLKDQVQQKNCHVCTHHAQRGQCKNGYAGFYQCRNQADGFKLNESK